MVTETFLQKSACFGASIFAYNSNKFELSSVIFVADKCFAMAMSEMTKIAMVLLEWIFK